MHENESSPNQVRDVTSEQTLHSDIHHSERLVDEFNDTPLSEEVERGLVNPSPDTPAGLAQSGPVEKKSHRKLIIGGAAFLAGAALVVGSFVGLKAASNVPKNTPPAPDPKPTSQTPEANPTSKPEVLTVASLEVPAGGTPEQLGTAFFQDRLSAWEMSGATPENQKAYFSSGGSVEFINSLADKNGNTFADALLVPGWRDNALLATWVGNLKKNNAGYLENWLLTYKSGIAGDTEAFKAYTTVESTTVDPQTNMLKTIVTDHNNADMNRIGSKYDPRELGLNGQPVTFQYTLRTIDGKAKISTLQ